jgi:hypothetical protein
VQQVWDANDQVAKPGSIDTGIGCMRMTLYALGFWTEFQTRRVGIDGLDRLGD